MRGTRCRMTGVPQSSNAEIMSHIHKYYVRSGRIGALAPLHVLFNGGAHVAVLAALYALVVRYNPFIYFSFIATVLFGALVGFAAAAAAQAGRSRSLPFNLLAALLLAVFGLWLHWLLWIALQLDHGAAVAEQLALSGPAGWKDFFTWLAQNYHLSVSRYVGSQGAAASTHDMLWIWGGEAAIVIALALLTATGATRIRLYSERTGKWASTALKIEAVGIDTTPDALRSAFERGDFSAFQQLERLDYEACRAQPSWHSVELELIAEPGDMALRAINVELITNRWDAKGKRKKNRALVVQNFLLPLAEYEALIERLRGFAIPVPPPQGVRR